MKKIGIWQSFWTHFDKSEKCVTIWEPRKGGYFMKLNDIDIVSAIVTSRKKLNWRKILIENIIIFCIAMGFGIAIGVHFLEYHAAWTLTTLFVWSFPKIHKFNKEKREAKRQLNYLINYLKEQGIDVNKVSLQKASVGKVQKYNYSINRLATDCDIEKIAVFEDNHQKLKALRQVRRDILICGASKKDAVIDSDYTEIVEREEEAKQLLLKINEGKRY